MTDFDPTDPWGSKSPWDVAQPNTAPEAPVTNPTVTENDDNVTLSFKGGGGYDASLLVLRAKSIADLDHMLDQEAHHLKSVMEKAAKVQAYSTVLNSGTKPAAPVAQPSFQGGQVQYGQPAAAGPSRPDNVPGHYEYREGTNKSGKPYKAWFPPKGSNESPIWVS